MTTTEQPVLTGITGDDYKAALAGLVTVCERFLTYEDPDYAETTEMHTVARRVSKALRDDGYRPREKMTRADVFRNALRRLSAAVDEYSDLAEYEDGALGLRVWEAFEGAVGSAASQVKRDEGDYWAPEDDTNPIKVVPVPEPDRSAEPINGVRQGDWIKAAYWDAPRRILTGPDDDGYVRVSDPRDGAGNFGGFRVQAKDIGTEYQPVDASGQEDSHG